MANHERGKSIRNNIGLVLYLCGGWRSYKNIGEEFGWLLGKYGFCKTAYRNVRTLEAAGLPVEWLNPPDQKCGGGMQNVQRVRLPQDWVARTTWLRRYIIRKEPLNAPAYQRSLHK